MVDINKIMAGITQSNFASGLAGGVAGGALTGALMSKKGRKTAKSLLKYGGVAAVGGLAWSAYRKYQQNQSGSPTASPADSQSGAGERNWQQLDQRQFYLAQQQAPETQSHGLLMIRAMITAAMSDGHLDMHEQRRIFEQTDELGLNPEEKATLFDELRNPRSVGQIAEQAADPAIAVEVYAASVLAIDENTEQGTAYLERLARLLDLPDSLVTAVHDQVGSPAPTTAAA